MTLMPIQCMTATKTPGLHPGDRLPVGEQMP